MKIWEIDLTKVGIVYKDSCREEWHVDEKKNLIRITDRCLLIKIEVRYALSELLGLTFTEVSDMSKVAVDTPVWVWDCDKINSVKRHFFKYSNGEYCVCFENGTTSHTSDEKIKKEYWANRSLTDPNKGE